jgi:GTPase SAR1 family protein
VEYAYCKYLTIEHEETRLEVLDMSCQGEFKGFDTPTLQKCSGYILVADLTDASSLDALKPIIEHLKRVRQDEKFPVIMIGNKKDSLDRVVEHHRLTEFCNALLDGCPVIETSAKECVNIYEAFRIFVLQARNILKKKPSRSAVTKSFSFFSPSEDDDIL